MPVLIITGANRGLGLEFARQYAADGWQIVAINRRSSDELDALAAEYPVQIIAADLTNDASLHDAVGEIDHNAVDLLINNAGTMGDGSFAETGFSYKSFGTFDRQEWLRVFDINICTPQALSELLVDKLEQASSPVIVTLSSMLGSNTMNTMGNSYAYRASKSAVNSIMKSMGMNLKDRGITCIAMHPGWVQTDMGGADADIDPVSSVTGMRKTIAGVSLADAGRFVAWDGNEMPY